MVPITVFTPAYNRADLLKRCYESMCRQTNKNFIWMIIDDGSTDNTKEVVDLWMLNNNGFEIQYYYKENGGLHTAYNEAIEHIDTELCVCIDSDDYMPDNAVEIILDFWKKNGSNEYAGIVGLDYTIDNHVIGDLLPDKKSINLIDLLIGKYHIHNGDRTNVVRTELYKKVAPMISFEGEKNFSPHYMHLQISKNYDFLVLNKNLRYVEYQADGMSNSIFKQYLNSPNSFIETRKLYLSLPGISWKFKLRQSIHLVSSGIIANKLIEVLKYIPSFGMTVLAVPCGLLLSKYIRIKAK
ncbi:glycosyltransferase family 2 protein [Catenibacterium mitsuokai]|uniref:glycosyltransferase family 2 protein n=1 Tax=Catenibacterium mitsuokai TaxID=100886 RepID=UPI003D053C5A